MYSNVSMSSLFREIDGDTFGTLQGMCLWHISLMTPAVMTIATVGVGVTLASPAEPPNRQPAQWANDYTRRQGGVFSIVDCKQHYRGVCCRLYQTSSQNATGRALFSFTCIGQHLYTLTIKRALGAVRRVIRRYGSSKQKRISMSKPAPTGAGSSPK